jgi:hypothetical protein
VDVVPRQVETNLTVTVSPNPFPWGITGYYGHVDDDGAIRYYSPLFLQVLREYSKSTRIYFADDGTCEGECRFDLVAAGWDIECHDWTNSYLLISREVVVATMQYVEPIYRSHLQWLAAALLITALACIAIELTFKGWWNLGRRVGMSPLEVAKVFDAPLLRQANPNGTGRDIVDAVGKDAVQYGAVSVGTGSSPLMQQCCSQLICSPRLDKKDDVG